jgi:hypothetical protein
MTHDSESYEIRSAARGPHWIAWLTRRGTDEPDRSIVIVGETQQEAEANAHKWLHSTYK